MKISSNSGIGYLGCSSSRRMGMLQRMHTARARDSARAQSGGVKGMLTDEDGELLTSAFLFFSFPGL